MEKNVRSLDAKHPVETNTVSGTRYTIIKVIKIRTFPCLCHKTTCRGSRGTAPLHLKIRTFE